MKKIKIINIAKTINYDENKQESLYDILENENIKISSACKGCAKCGKCKIKTTDIDDITIEEKLFLSQKEIAKKIRLACMYYPKNNIEIYLNNKEDEFLEEHTLEEKYIDVNANIKKYLFKIENNEIISKENISKEVKNQIENYFYDKKDFNSKLLYTAVIINDNKLLAIEKPDSRLDIYSVAVDIGTSTIVMSLVNLLDGKELDIISSINPQVEYGLDILSRITYSNEKENLEKLHLLLIDKINDMLSNIASNNNIKKQNIYEIVIAANTSLMHFLFNKSPKSIGYAPYTALFLNSKNIKAKDISIKELNEEANLYSLANVSGYIGSDILSGVHISKMIEEKRNVLLIDIGTNAEIVLSEKGKLIACSCAAGPAFEAMNISSGIRAVSGAIIKVEIKNEKINYKTINNEKAIGICGSGVFSCISEFRKCGLIKEDGQIIKEEDLALGDYRKKFLLKEKRSIIIDEKNDIFFSQKDIREVQLAKGAISSAIKGLLNFAKIDITTIDVFYLAGQFASNIEIESLITTGIIDKSFRGKYKYLANSSKKGAYLCIVDKDERGKIEKLAKKIKVVNLNDLENYEELFISSLDFPSLEY